jgi:hypothetical protein
MKEASRVKYYFVKYFLLTFALLQALVVLLTLLKHPHSEKSKAVVFVFATLAFASVSFHFLVQNKIRRVAIGKKGIIVYYSNKRKSYSWQRVKEVRPVAFFNMYSLKLKGNPNRIYFLPSYQSEALFGLFTSKPVYIPKKINKG